MAEAKTVDSADLLRVMRDRKYRPLTQDELAAEFGIAERERPALACSLRQLERQGEIVCVKQ